VRYVEDNSQNGTHSLGHGHHHHHHKRHESSDESKADHEGKNMNKAGGESSVDGAKLNDETFHESKATIRKVYLTLVGNLDPKLPNMFFPSFHT
jgi:solute carrier family 39 (zinc transporter), member 7